MIRINMNMRADLFQEPKNASNLTLDARALLEAEQMKRDREKAKKILDEILEKALRNMVSSSKSGRQA